MQAELIFLAQEQFTGEARYWHDGAELRRNIKHILTTRNDESFSGSEKPENVKRAKDCIGKIDGWCQERDGEMTIFFEHGYIKRIEY